MCEPMTIAAIGATLVTGYLQADAQKAQGEYNAQVAENNAAMARRQADDANALGTREMERASWRSRAIMGQQRASIAANNLDPTMGTPADILGESALFGEMEQQDIRLNALRQAWGYNVEARNYQNEAGLSRWQGSTGARMTILGSLAQSAALGAGAWGGGTTQRRAAKQGANAVNMSGGFRGLGGWGY